MKNLWRSVTFSKEPATLLKVTLLHGCFSRFLNHTNPKSRNTSHFFVIIRRYYKDVCVNRFFPRTAGQRNSLPAECFPLPYDLNGLKSRVNKPAVIYLFKVNNGNTRTMCESYSKLTTKTSERRQWRRSGILIANFEQISHIVLVFSLLTLTKKILAGKYVFNIVFFLISFP